MYVRTHGTFRNGREHAHTRTSPYATVHCVCVCVCVCVCEGERVRARTPTHTHTHPHTPSYIRQVSWVYKNCNMKLLVHPRWWQTRWKAWHPVVVYQTVCVRVTHVCLFVFLFVCFCLFVCFYSHSLLFCRQFECCTTHAENTQTHTEHTHTLQTHAHCWFCRQFECGNLTNTHTHTHTERERERNIHAHSTHSTHSTHTRTHTRSRFADSSSAVTSQIPGVHISQPVFDSLVKKFKVPKSEYQPIFSVFDAGDRGMCVCACVNMPESHFRTQLPRTPPRAHAHAHAHHHHTRPRTQHHARTTTHTPPPTTYTITTTHTRTFSDGTQTQHTHTHTLLYRIWCCNERIKRYFTNNEVLCCSCSNYRWYCYWCVCVCVFVCVCGCVCLCVGRCG